MENLKKYLKTILQIRPPETQLFDSNELQKRQTILFDVELKKLLSEFDNTKNNILRYVSENKQPNKDIIETLVITEVGEINFHLYNLISLANFNNNLKSFLSNWSKLFFNKVETIQNSYENSPNKTSIIELIEMSHLLEDGKKDFLTQLRKYKY